ncbi:MAG: glycosyltransferase [Pseudohongiellaceae bacterium]
MNVVHAYLFFSIKFAGGTSDLIYKICKAQEKQNHEPVIYCGDYKFDDVLAKRLPATRFKVINSWLDRQGFSIMPNLKRELKRDRSNIDIVHMHAFRTFQNYILYKFCQKNRIPFVIDAHGAVPYYVRKNKLKRVFDRLVGRKMLRDADFLIAETQVGVDEYLEIDSSLARDKIVILSPPFDTDEFDELPEAGQFKKKYQVPADKKIIMFIGRVHHIKGNDFLIEGFADLCQRRNDCLLMIVGSDDGHMEECKVLVKNLNIDDRVTFTGFIGGHDKNSALIDADIVVQMSRQEQGAWAPFEAVLCGTPIIVTDGTGAGEDVKRVDAGETVRFGEIKQLSQTIESILDNYDAALEKTELARSFILTRMSMNARAHEYIDVYKKAIEGKKVSLA